MDRADQLGTREDQLVEAGALGDAAAVEERPHRPVEEDRGAGEPLMEGASGGAGREIHRWRLG